VGEVVSLRNEYFASKEEEMELFVTSTPSQVPKTKGNIDITSQTLVKLLYYIPVLHLHE